MKDASEIVRPSVVWSGVFFDLDGTLADTAPDLARSLNMLRGEHDVEPLAYEAIRPWVSHGTDALLRLGFGQDYAADPTYAELRERYLELYLRGIADETRLFPGIAELLERLEGLGIAWGVVTNKPAFLTDPLMEALNLNERAACAVSGDTTAFRKPHPAPLLYACKIAGCQPGTSVYIGDAQRDIEAGRRAGMQTLAALFGYIASEESPLDWQADGHIETAHDILPWLGLAD
ncbi:MAG: HAD-IA family hydrolase [Gammaproteobacteria bacterium]|nr:HAD-IA family hydrolase [Gammaproteobacteria bacterium]